MTNRASSARPLPADRSRAPRAQVRRRRLARLMPAASCILACLLLTVAATVDGAAAALVLGGWLVLLLIVGLRLTAPRRAATSVKRPVLVIAALDERGDVGDAQMLPVVATAAATATLRNRPRG
jgi:hypothetical protein